MPRTGALRIYLSCPEIIFTEWIIWTSCKYAIVSLMKWTLNIVNIFLNLAYLFAMNQQHHVDSNADITISCVAVGERSVESLSLLQVILFLGLLVMETFVL